MHQNEKFSRLLNLHHVVSWNCKVKKLLLESSVKLEPVFSWEKGVDLEVRAWSWWHNITNILKKIKKMFQLNVEITGSIRIAMGEKLFVLTISHIINRTSALLYLSCIFLDKNQSSFKFAICYYSGQTKCLSPFFFCWLLGNFIGIFIELGWSWDIWS